jgi:hypothetical protein
MSKHPRIAPLAKSLPKESQMDKYLLQKLQQFLDTMGLDVVKPVTAFASNDGNVPSKQI